MKRMLSDEGPADELVVECELDAPPEQVWRALTIPELAAEWLVPDEPSTPGPAPSFRVIDADPCARVRYACTDPSNLQPETIFTIELASDPQGRTRLRLTHSLAPARTMIAANRNAPPVAMLAA
jgi:uncharacterized protein YndB with AHSA1/START domain